LERKNKVFASYKVKSKNNTYLVELRSITQNINSMHRLMAAKQHLMALHFLIQ